MKPPMPAPLSETVRSAVEAVRRSAAPAVLIGGPARSGKTTAALASGRQLAEQAAAGGRCLFLAPGSAAARHLTRRLMAATGRGVLFEPDVVTFEALAERLIASSGRDVREIGPLERSVLLRQVMDALARRGRLRGLGRLADTPGVTTALEAAISELKRSAIEPQALREAMEASGALDGGDNRGELLAVYEEYQRRLNEQGAYDLEGRMWLARDVVASAHAQCPPLANVAVVVADGFTDFTPTQMEILSHLAARQGKLILTLPLADDGRERLWRWSERTRQRLRRQLGERLEEIRLDGPDPEPGGLGWLAGELFSEAPTREPAHAPRPRGLEILAAAGEQAEVTAAARQIKQQLVEGTPAGEIALVARDLASLREPIQQIFEAFEIPLQPPPRALTDTAIVRFLLAAMELPERCTWRDVLAVLNSSYFRPQALGPFTAATVAEAERLIRGGQAVLGREALLESCRRQAQRQGRNEYEDEEEPQHVPADADASPRALALLEALFERIESARREPQTAIDAFELPRAALHSGRDSLIALDLRAIQALRTALGQIPAEWARTPNVLGELLRRIVLPGERSDSAVEVLDALDARSLRFRRVYVLGCGEGQFPRRMGAAPLIRESDRAAWAAHGLELDLREDLAAREMLLFYLTVSRGEDSLTASYPVSDGSGRAAAAGSFLEALLEPLGGLAAAEAAAPWFRRMPAGRFLPHPHPAASVREALSTALAGAATTDGPPFAAELSWCREHVPAALEQAARGLAIAHRRWSEAPLDAWDGRLDDPQLLQDLRRDADERVFSASQLNRYARCPFSYFCETVLGLDPLAEPQRVLEPLKQGLFCHAVLAETFKRLYGSDVQPPAEDLPRLDRRRAETALNAAIEECSRRFAGEGIAYPTLWTIQRDRLAARLRRYLREEISSGPRRRPVAFEQAFGAPSADEQARGLQREALAVSAGQRQIRLRGRIDRIDRVLGPAAEGLVVIDYKAGKPPANKAIKNGRDTQIPLYAAAVQQLYSGEDVLGGRYHTLDPKASHTGLSAADGDADDGSGAVQHLREALAGALAAVASHVDAIAAGRFDALGHEDCPGHCPYRLICRRSPAREQIKTADESEAAS